MNGNRGSGYRNGEVREIRLHETRDHQFLSEPLVFPYARGERVNADSARFFMLFFAAARSARCGTESTSRLLELIS